MRRFGYVLCGLMILLGAGCAGGRGALAPKREASESVRAEVLDSLRSRNDGLRGLRGMATVRYGSPLFGARGETVFAAQGPNRLRIDGLADFGLYHSQIALDGRKVTILWPVDRRYFEGAATPETLGRYLLVGLPPETIVEILLGKLPGIAGADPAVFETKRAGLYVVKGDRVEALVETIAVSGDADGPRDYVPVHYMVLNGAGRPVYRVAFERYGREGGSAWFAERMTARFWEVSPSQTKARIEVEFKEIEVNPRLDAKLFELRIPKDAEPVSDM